MPARNTSSRVQGRPWPAGMGPGPGAEGETSMRAPSTGAASVLGGPGSSAFAPATGMSEAFTLRVRVVGG